MRRLHLVAAAVATCIVLIIAAAGFMMIRLLQPFGRSVAMHPALHLPIAGYQAVNQAVGISLLAGVSAWLVLLLLRRDGMHCLAKLNTIRPKS